MSDEVTKSSFGEKAIAVNIFLLKLCGILPFKTTLIIKLDWTNLLAAISFISLSTYSVSYSYEFIVHMSHADTALEFFSMIISLVGGQARYVILYLKRKKFRNMLKLCERLWTSLDRDERSWVIVYTNKTKRLTYYYLFGCAFTIFFYAIASLFVSTDIDNANGTSIRNLPYAFILDIHESPYFETAYAYQLITMIDVGLTCVGADTVGPVMILIACGHLKVIQNKMSSLLDETKSIVNEYDRDNDESYYFRDVRIKFNGYVNYHGTVLEFCKDIEELANVIFLTQLIGSTYNISLVGFKLAGDDPDKYKYTTQVLIAVIQLFLCNWPPDVLLFETAAVANSAYSTPWYIYPIELRRSMHIVIMRSQKAIRLTAGKFAYLSLETFASMISTAASFFTMIRSMN